MKNINLSKIEQAHNNIKSYIHLTPVFESKLINSFVNRNVYFKCENLQKTGSFKIRGALNSILCKKRDNNIKGVTTHSSGNHGQAVAHAASMLGIPSVIVVPKSTPTVKCNAIRSYGADLRLCDDSPRSRVETCAAISAETGYTIIHPYDDYDTMCGQGTLGLEFFNQIPQLDAVLISVSGGGLCAGCAVALSALKPNIQIYCVEPEGKELEKSLRAGQRLWTDEPRFLNTIAEGIRTQQPGHLTFPILCDIVEKDVFTVNDSDMISGMKLSMTYLKLVIEAAAGATVQALIKYNDKIPISSRNIGVILCGGNVDVADWL